LLRAKACRSSSQPRAPGQSPSALPAKASLLALPLVFGTAKVAEKRRRGAERTHDFPMSTGWVTVLVVCRHGVKRWSSAWCGGRGSRTCGEGRGALRQCSLACSTRSTALGCRALVGWCSMGFLSQGSRCVSAGFNVGQVEGICKRCWSCFCWFGKAGDGRVPDRAAVYF
jgi:hypothetical protein